MNHYFYSEEVYSFLLQEEGVEVANQFLVKFAFHVIILSSAVFEWFLEKYGQEEGNAFFLKMVQIVPECTSSSTEIT